VFQVLTFFCFTVFFFRLFKHFRSEGFSIKSEVHEALLQQWVILGTACSLVDILPYSTECRALLIIAMVASPTKVSDALYGPLTSSLGAVGGSIFSHVRGLHEGTCTAILRRVRFHLTPMWGTDGVFEVTELQPKEVEAVIADFQQIAGNLFRERKQRQKLAFTQSVGRPSQLYSTSNGDRSRFSLQPQMPRSLSDSGSDDDDANAAVPAPLVPRVRKHRRSKSGRSKATPSQREGSRSRTRGLSLDDTATYTDERSISGRQAASEEKPRSSSSSRRKTRSRSPLKASSSSMDDGQPKSPMNSDATRPVRPAKCGQRVVVTMPDKNVVSGVLRFRGRTQFYSGEWCGVELDALLGKNNGTVQGVEYFKCASNFGLFVRPAAVALPVATGNTPAEPKLKMGLRRRLI